MNNLYLQKKKKDENQSGTGQKSTQLSQVIERPAQQPVQRPAANPAGTPSGGYQSKWQQGLDSTMDKILNREKFSYDLNGDALWNQYKDQYTQQGKMAMMDTMGQAAALTGGYGSSYGQTVGQQTYQGYLQQMNQMIPELYQLALNKYQMEGDALMDQYGLMADQEDREYGRYVDDRNYEYQVGRDAVADQQWQAQFDENKRQYDQEYEYQVGRDQIEDQRYADEFAYQQSRDEVADQQWNQSFEYQQGRDQIEDQRYQDEFAYQQGRDEVSDRQWQAEFDEDKRRYDQEYADSKSGGSGGSGGGSSDKYKNMSKSEIETAIASAGSEEEATQLAEDMVADGVDEEFAYSIVEKWYGEKKDGSSGGGLMTGNKNRVDMAV